MTPTERAIKNIEAKRAEAATIMRDWDDDPELYREVKAYVRRCENALSRLRKGNE